MREKGPTSRVVRVTAGRKCGCCRMKASRGVTWFLFPRLAGGERLVCRACSQKTVPFRWGGRKYGTVNHHTKVWTLWRVNPVHFTDKFQGYGSYEDVLEELVLEGIEWVRIIEQRTIHKWTMYVPIWTWLQSGTKATLNPKVGEQIFLRMDQLPIGHPWDS